MTGQPDGTLPARMRRGRLDQIEKQCARISDAVAEVLEMVARLRAADERERATAGE